ncbi:MAG TPA: TonB family protein, partial [Kofleriaceae bacterium]
VLRVAIEQLGRYTVLQHIATGGMADVLLARTDGIEGYERHVVLKRIRAEHAKDKRFITMFVDEARVAAGLHHQNIVQVYDIGESNGEYFFAMEYIHGEDLRKLLSAVSKSRKHMPLDYVCSIVSAAASGLHYAHERRDNSKRALNIVHRDVSPSNILIGYDGAVKVVDFGIAKAAMRTVETRSGSLKGKVSYMSPEQCKGEDIDRRSDVYALGVLLYELTTTTRLFKGDNDYLVMDAIVNGKVPLPRVRRPDLPNELSSIIMRALAVDANRRYQTAEDLRMALEHFAVKNNLTASTAALASYMRKMFGERPEPWLELAARGPNIDVEAPTQSAHHSWSELARDSFAEGDTQNQFEAKSATDERRSGSGRRSGVKSAVALGDTIAPPVSDTIGPPISTRETRTSMKLGWEARSRFAQARGKLLWVAVPVLAIVGFGIWQLAMRNDDAQPAPARPAAAAHAPTVAPIAPTPTVTPIQPEIPAVRVAGAEPAAEPVAAPAPEPASVDVAKPAKHAKTDHIAKAASAKQTPAATPKAAPTPPPAVIATAPAPVPAAAPAPVVVPPPAPAPEPKEVEVPIPSLSNATVSAVASDHSRQLSGCEGSADLHGDVAVSFQIDATGKVVKSQLSSSVKNPKVAGCILKAVQSWKFPKPPSGSAKGVYSISYQ